MITAGAGLVFGLLPAVLIGVLLTLFLVLRELDRAGFTELQPTVDDDDMRVAGSPGASPVPGLLVLRYDAPLYTANIRSVHRKVIAAVDARSPVPDVVVLDVTAVGTLTVTVIDEVPQLERELAARGVTFWVAAVRPRAVATAKLLPRWQEK